MAGSTYVFRQDLADEKQRQHDLATQGLPPSNPTQQAAPQQQPTGQDPFAALAKQVNSQPSPPQQSVNPYEAFQKAIEAQNPFREQLQQQVSQGLQNPYQAVDAATKAAQDQAAREANAAAEERRGQAISAYGGYQTGQATRDLNKFQDARLLNEQSAGLAAAANRAQVGDQTRNNAITQGMNLLGQDTQNAQTAASLAESAAGRASQEKIAFAGLSQQDRQLAQQASQFNSQLDFQKAALQQGYDQAAIDRAWQASQNAQAQASQEKIAFAGLSIQEKQLAQQALQFDNQLDFQKAALANGNDQAAIDRAWNAAQQDKQTASQEKIAFAGLSLEEQKLAQQASQFTNQLDFQKAALANGNDQAAIDRAWQAAQQEKQTASQEKIAFAGLSFQEKQLAQQALQANSELDFKKQALANGNDQAAIDRAWQAAQQDKQIWAQQELASLQIGSAERLQASQQHFQASESDKQITLEKMLSQDRIHAQYGLAQMDQTFQTQMQQTGYVQTKDLQKMQQDFQAQLQQSGIQADTAKQLADQQFQSLMAQREQAFTATQQDLQNKWNTGERISSQDYTTSLKQLDNAQQDLMQQREIAAQLGMQTTQIDAQLRQTQLQIASQELMSAAQLAQTDAQFAKEFNLKYNVTAEQIAQSQLRLQEDLKTSVLQREALGLSNAQMEQTLKNDKVNSALQLASIGMQMGNGSAEAMAPFVAQMGTALESALKAQGINISASAIQSAFGPLPGTTSTGGTASSPSGLTVGTVQAAKDTLNSLQDSLPAGVNFNGLVSTLDNLKAENLKPDGQLDGRAVRNTMAALPGAKANLNTAYQDFAIARTQAGADYYVFALLDDRGLTPKQAFDVTASMIGQDRMKAAYKALTGKDWAG